MSLEHLEKLKSMVPPLDPPRENKVDWEMAERVFSIKFPEDFKQFILAYGNLLWCDLFRLIYPRTESLEACQKSLGKMREILSGIFYSKLYDQHGNVLEVAPYPAVGGLLPCISDIDGDFVCWQMKGVPEEWTMVLYQQGNLFLYPCDFSQLICDWVAQIPPAADLWGHPADCKLAY